MKITIDRNGERICVPEDRVERIAMQKGARVSAQVQWNDERGIWECVMPLWQSPMSQADKDFATAPTIPMALHRAYDRLARGTPGLIAQVEAEEFEARVAAEVAEAVRPRARLLAQRQQARAYRAMEAARHGDQQDTPEG